MSAPAASQGLHCLRIKSPQERLAYLSDFDPESNIWICADSFNVNEIFESLFARRKTLVQSAVMRAPHLWRKLYSQIEPGVQWIHGESLYGYASHWRHKIATTAQCDSRVRLPSPSTLLEATSGLLPLMAHSQGLELLSEWFTANPESKARWGDIAQHSFAFYKWLGSVGHLPESWAIALLSQHEDLGALRVNLVVDLGTQLTSIEGQVLKEISLNNPVTILTPDLNAHSALFKLPKAYFWLGATPDINSKKTSRHTSSELSDSAALTPWRFPPHTAVRRFLSVIHEIKFTLASVRELLDSGVAPESICVQVGNLDSYLPIFSHLAQAEGIPLSIGKKFAVQSRIQVQSWLARLKLRLLPIRFEDLKWERSAAGSELAFDEFRKNFKKSLFKEDISRDSNLSQQLLDPTYLVSPETRWSVSEFIAWTSLLLQGEDFELTQTLLVELLRESPAEIDLTAVEWLEWLQKLAARTSYTQQNEGNLQLQPLRTQLGPRTKYLFVLGLCAENIDSQPPFLNSTELEQLATDLGFFFEDPLARALEFHLAWNLNDTVNSHEGLQQISLHFAELDHQAHGLTPSLFWMMAATELGESSDHLQEPSFEKQLLFDQEQHSMSMQRASQANDETHQVNLGPWTPKRLSVSALSQFHRCPFIFYAQRLLKLKDEPDLDLDWDRLTAGRIHHHLLEEMLKHNLASDIEIPKIIAETLTKLKIPKRADFLQRTDVYRLEKWLRSWHSYESKFRQAHPLVHTLGVEVPFKVHFDPQSLTFNNEGNGIPFQGVIDRIDGVDDSDGLLVMDYKLSTHSYGSHAQWLQNKEYQLALYSAFIEKGWVNGIQGQVVSAVYFDLKDFSRGKGFALESARGSAPTTLDGAQASVSRSLRISPAEKRQLFEEILESVGKEVEQLMKGDFTPRPADLSYCETCRWRPLCRAPHLN